MTGFVDEHLRALVPVSISAARDGKRTEILAWVDTAFNGGLTILEIWLRALAWSRCRTSKQFLPMERPSNCPCSNASLTGSAIVTRRKSPRAMGSSHSWELCY